MKHEEAELRGLGQLQGPGRGASPWGFPIILSFGGEHGVGGVTAVQRLLGRGCRRSWRQGLGRILVHQCVLVLAGGVKNLRQTVSLK